jgi:hypothetical protein
MASAEDVVALLCWTTPERMCVALERQLAAQPERAGAMSRSERLRLVAEAEARLMTLERKEEILIERAADEGFEILRRSDASPPAVLGVAVAKAQVQ